MGGRVSPNLDLFGQTEKGGGRVQKLDIFLDVINVWSLKVNCHNSRTSNDTDMTFGPATKLDKGNKTA